MGGAPSLQKMQVLCSTAQIWEIHIWVHFEVAEMTNLKGFLDSIWRMVYM